MIVASETARLPLRGLALILARALWGLLAALVFGLVILSIPLWMGNLVTLPQIERVLLAHMGLSVEFYALSSLIFELMVLVTFASTAAAIFWRRSEDWMALLVSVALLTIATAITPSLDALHDTYPWLGPVVTGVRGAGVGATLLVLYLFPDGRFVPRWTRILALGWGAYLLTWVLFPAQPMDMTAVPWYTRSLAYFLMIEPQALSRTYDYLRLFGLLTVLLAWFGSGVAAQNIRFKHISSPAQRQQTKWIVLALTLAIVGYFAYQIPLNAVPALREPGLSHLLFVVLGQPVYGLTLLLVPIFIAVSILRYRLWDIDLLINRALVYGGVTGLMGVLYIGSILALQRLAAGLAMGEMSDVAIAIVTLALVTLFQPVRRRMQDVIDRVFYREKVDFRHAFTDFSRQVRTIIEMPELLEAVLSRTTDLLHIEHGAVFLFDTQNDLTLAAARGIAIGERRGDAAPSATRLDLTAGQTRQLQAGIVVARRRDPLFPLLVPLLAPRAAQANGAERRAPTTLKGVLALGPRRSGLGYFREDQALLVGLADQTGTAIYVAQLIAEHQAEAQRREAVEQRLAAHRASPIGQAEGMAGRLGEQSALSLSILHDLANQAGTDPGSASLLANLPNALNSQGEPALAQLAEGFNYFFTAQLNPELAPVGLRTMIGALSHPGALVWDGAEDALAVYLRCQSALEANSILQIVDRAAGWERNAEKLEPSAPSAAASASFLSGLRHALSEFQAVAASLSAISRVDASQDKLAYLAAAVERLRRIDYLARLDLGSADRALVQVIIQTWSAIVTGAISDLQTRAHIVCQLITRHTWQDDVISLTLSLRNAGRGPATALRVTLASDQDYSLVDEAALLPRLAASEEAQVSLRIRPRLEKGIEHLRARFIILYTDPRGVDQVENFADVVQLLATETPFEFVPNPYVVGTPLPGGSALFFGREDIITFVQENLAALHRNNLVLIGQRRTGKTSLLKQLPLRLGDEYLPVYLDGQALGLDPGMRNFFLSLATEISFALEDRGLASLPLAPEDFDGSPAATFERGFLPKVRQAIGSRHLLLMLDEFEELETAVRRGDLDASVFGFLRHLIQHSENLSVIFCGTHRLEELASNYWNVLFNISLYKHIAFLDRAEAQHLIQEPVRRYGVRYDDLALDKIWRVTAGHPYFLQLLCHSLVNRHNQTQRNYMTVADVNAALDDILASGEAHFVYLWAESTQTERLALTSLSRLSPLSGRVTPLQVAEYLEERSVSVDRQAISDALHHLALRDVLRVSRLDDPTLGDAYQWELGLLCLWVEKYKSLGRILNEGQS